MMATRRRGLWRRAWRWATRRESPRRCRSGGKPHLEPLIPESCGAACWKITRSWIPLRRPATQRDGEGSGGPSTTTTFTDSRLTPSTHLLLSRAGEPCGLLLRQQPDPPSPHVLERLQRHRPYLCGGLGRPGPAGDITVNDGSGPQIANIATDFSQGAWVNVLINVAAAGTVTVTVTRTAGMNAAVSGIFLG